VLRLGLILGGVIGAVVAILFSQPKEEESLRDPESGNLVDLVKHQVRDAQVAAQAEAKAKEAEMLADYETSRHSRNHEP
jgi:gas vesicle protein